MKYSNYTSLDDMFRMQSFDASTNTFAGPIPGDKKKRIYLGALWIGEPIIGLDEGTLISLQSLLAGNFPAGTVIQFGVVSAPDIDETIADYLYRKRNATHPLLTELANRQAELISNGKKTPVVRSTGVLLSRKRIIVSMKCEYDKAEQTNLIKFNELTTSLDSSLKANSLYLSRATPHEYLELVRLLTHMYDKPDSRYDENIAINEQVFYTGDDVEVEKDHIKFNTGSDDSNNFVVAAMSPKFFPKDFHMGMMNYVMGDPRGVSNQLKLPYFMVMTLYYPEQMAKKAEIDKKASWINHQLFGGSTAKFLHGLTLKKEGFDILQAEIESNSAILVETSFSLWVYGRNLPEVKSMQEDIRTYWATLGFDVRPDKIILDVLLGECLPLNGSFPSAQGLNRTHTLTTSQASQFLPMMGEWRGTKNPSILLTTRRGEVAGFDLYSSSTNFNGVLVAQAGSGKSFWTQALISAYLAEGAKVWVIDSGRSYMKLCAGVGGTFMEFSPDSNVCMNPFTSFLPERGGADKRIDDEIEMLSSLVERMVAQRDSIGDTEMVLIQKAIRQTFIENQGHTTIQDISNWLSAQTGNSMAKDMALRMDRFAYGQYAKFFNGHSNVNMEADFVVCELDDLKSQKQLQQVVLLQLVSQITHEMYLTRGRKKILIIDEAFELLDDPVMARAMEVAYRQARKMEGAVLTVTQGLNDMYNSPAGKAMVANAAWQLILAQKAEVIDEVYNSGKLVLDGYNYQMLKTVRTVPGSHSEIMIVGDGNVGIFRMTVDRFTQAMYSTSGKDRTQVLDDIENGVDVIESVQRLIVGDNAYQRLQKLESEIEELMRTGSNRHEIANIVRNAAARVEATLEIER